MILPVMEKGAKDVKVYCPSTDVDGKEEWALVWLWILRWVWIFWLNTTECYITDTLWTQNKIQRGFMKKSLEFIQTSLFAKKLYFFLYFMNFD